MATSRGQPFAIAGRAPTPSRAIAASASSSSASARPLSSAARGSALTARERRAAVDRLDPELLAELKEAFQLFDSDEDGAIDVKELKAAFKALGVDVKTADVRKMLSEAGRDDESGVNFDTFLELIASRLPDRNSPEEIAKVFALFDTEGTGKISLRELKRVVSELGEDIGEEELRDMIEEADRDGDGAVTFEDFFRIMRRKGDPWGSDDEDS